ncbi:hypothetical protein T01_14494 [Trichinella spiralis]|uniref:Uncharacterized protein n=1 Tax=Trichinella spiralis TaxID=6334 RepID=A0A0V1AQN1_TRISP|nr:hypothetical protein T01_14494 [Trichinella spiralis]
MAPEFAPHVHLWYLLFQASYIWTSKNVFQSLSAKIEFRHLSVPVIKADSRDLKGLADGKKGMRRKALSGCYAGIPR